MFTDNRFAPPSSDRSWGCMWLPMPALLIRMPSPPKAVSEASNSATISAGSRVSHLVEMAVPPAAVIIAAVSAAVSAFRSETATFAPARERPLAIARPSPDPAPVTTATRPVRSNSWAIETSIGSAPVRCGQLDALADFKRSHPAGAAQPLIRVGKQAWINRLLFAWVKIFPQDVVHRYHNFGADVPGQ